MKKLCGKEIRSVLGIPSGIVATDPAIIDLLIRMIPDIGFIETKSMSKLPKKGPDPEIIARYGLSWSLMNAVCLDNIGTVEAAKALAKIKIPSDFVLLGSVFGATPDEFSEAAGPIVPYVSGLVSNVSCSHAKKVGLQIGQDIDLTCAVLKQLILWKLPVFVKLSPRMNICEIVKKTRDLGIAGYIAINTLGPKELLIDGKPVLTNKLGSVSGREITELALRCMKETRRYTDLTIIGGGGIFTGQDARNALDVVDFCAIGTANAGMSTHKMVKYFPKVLYDIKNGTNKAEKFVTSIANDLYPKLDYKRFYVAENEKPAKDLFVLHFEESMECGPGQFVFVLVPGVGARPFSIYEDHNLALQIGIRGKCTKYLSKLKPGDWVRIRGPYGKIPKVLGKKILLIGGGNGSAALRAFAEKFSAKTTDSISETIAVLGAKNLAHLYCESFQHFCSKTYLYTEDGKGKTKKGLVTQDLDEIFRDENPDFCLICGPEEMIVNVMDIAEKYLPKSKILGAKEYHTACGFGMCGKDKTKKGWRSCVDGPFMVRSMLGI